MHFTSASIYYKCLWRYCMNSSHNSAHSQSPTRIKLMCDIFSPEWRKFSAYNTYQQHILILTLFAETNCKASFKLIRMFWREKLNYNSINIFPFLPRCNYMLNLYYISTCIFIQVFILTFRMGLSTLSFFSSIR